MGKNRKNNSRRYQYRHNDRTTLTPDNLAALKTNIEAKRQLLCRSASFHSKIVVPMLRTHGFDVAEFALSKGENEDDGGVDAIAQPHPARGLNEPVPTTVKIRCLGLGSPSSPIETQPKFQLAYLLHLAACLRVEPANVSLYDPVFSELDMALLVDEFGFRVDLQDPFVGGIGSDSAESQEGQEGQNDIIATGSGRKYTRGTTIVPLSSAAGAGGAGATTKVLYYLPHIPLSLMENVIQQSQPLYMIGNDMVEHVAKLRLAEVWARYPQVARMSVLLEEKSHKQKELEKQRQQEPQTRDEEIEKENWQLKGGGKLAAHGEERSAVGEDGDDNNKNTNKHRHTSTGLRDTKSQHRPGDNGAVDYAGASATNNNSANDFQQVKPRGNRRQKSQAAKLRAAGASEQALRAEILGSVKMAVRSAALLAADRNSGATAACDTSDTASCGGDGDNTGEYLRRWSVDGEWARVNSEISNSNGGSGSSSAGSSEDDGWGSSFSDLAVLCA